MFDKIANALKNWFKGKAPHEFKFSDRFRKDAKRLAKKDHDLEAEILAFCKAVRPKDGDPVSKTGGCRKVRMEGKGKGKSGGYRVMIFAECKEQIHFLHMYPKNEKEDLTKLDKKLLRQAVEEIKKDC